MNHRVPNPYLGKLSESPQPEKKRVYRTKLESILKEKGWSQQRFIDKYNRKFPDTPMCKDHLSRIVSGKRTGYTITTLFRFCAVLKKKPNQILDFEDHI